MERPKTEGGPTRLDRFAPVPLTRQLLLVRV
jgi:hypothetical protein